MSPVRVLVPAITAVLLVGALEPTSLVVALSSLLLLRPSRAENVLHYLSRFYTLNGLLFGGFVGIGDGGSKDVFNHAPREAFYEELDGLWISKVVSCNSSKAFEVIRVLVDFGPLQAEGFQLCSGTLLTLRILVLGCKFCEELLPNGGDVIDWLEGVNPFSHSSGPFGNEWSLDKREGEGYSLDV